MALYADLGTDTNISGQVAGGTGTLGDPYNARGWWDRVRGAGNFSDEYLIKGSAHSGPSGGTFTNIQTFSKLDAWDLATNGPWRFKNTSSTIIQLGSTNSIVTNAVLNISGNQFRVKNGTKLYDCYVFGDSNPMMMFDSGNVFDLKGCVIDKRLQMIAFSGVTWNIENTVLYQGFHSSQSGSCTLNITKSVFIETGTGDFSGTFSVTDDGSQFSFVATNSPVSNYLESDKDEFLLDPSVSIGSSGVFTNHLTGIFGNDRAAYEAATSNAAIGASYFPIPASIGGGGQSLTGGMGLGLKVAI